MAYDVVILEEAKEFLDKLEPKMMAKSYRTIKMLSESGPLLTLPHSRKIAGTNDLFRKKYINEKENQNDQENKSEEENNENEK